MTTAITMTTMGTETMTMTMATTTETIEATA
jgi:hypothetical protein